MSRLSELIAELCPDGVEYRQISGLYTKLRGTPITAATMKKIANDGGDTIIFAGGKTVVRANESDIPKVNVIRRPSVVVQSRGVIDFIYCDEPFTFKNEMWAYTCDDTVSVKFLYYALKSNVDRFRVLASAMSSLPQIAARDTEEHRIPVPPIEVQREIVRILDSFQELDDALTAEIEARERQLKELRLGLTDDSRFNEKQLMPLSRVALFSGGHTPSKVELDNYADGQSGISWITSKDVKRDYLGVSQITLTDKGAAGLKLYPVGTTVMVTRSGILRHYLPIASMSVESTVNQDIRCICPKEGVNADYVFEVLKARADYMLRAFFNLGGTVDSINFNRVKAMVIPVPDINEQLRIVDAIKPAERLLDLLRSERDARRKQFAYYRDKLLDLPEKVTTNG